MNLTIEQLAVRLNAELIYPHGACNGPDRHISSVAAVEAAGESNVTFITGDKYMAALKKSGAAAVIVDRRLEEVAIPQLLVKNVGAALISALEIFAPELKPVARGIDPTARIGQNVRIAEGVAIGEFVVIDDGVEIGQNSVISSGCKIGENSKVGKNCRLDRNVVVYHNCRLGSNVIIQANSTIGSVGFGYSFIDGAHRLIPHNGGVVIEDFVEIGACCCVDRAKFGDTIIGAGTKIDNLVQIAHNVVIGKCCLIAGQVGISGSCKLGDGVVLGGQVGLADNIEIGKGTKVAAKSGVIKDVAAGQQIGGTPAVDIRETFRMISSTRRLPKLVEQLKDLINRVERLEAAKDHKS
jgi:UDP-3-O-[3-hydroxymyristoyl] glucosamine N-acyltransferase